MKKAILFLLVLILLPTAAAFAAEPEPNGELAYYGPARFKFSYPGERPERVRTDGFVVLYYNGLLLPAPDQFLSPLIHMEFFEGDGADILLPDQNGLCLDGMTDYTESGRISHFWVIEEEGTTGSGSPASEQDGSAAAIGEFRTRNHNKRMQLKGQGVFWSGEMLIHFEFRFRGQRIEDL